MSLRSLLTLLAVFLVVLLGLWIAWLNPQPVTLRVPGLEPFETRLWVVCFLSLLAGVFVALVYSMVLSSREALSRWRLRRREKLAAENLALLQKGLRARARDLHQEALTRFESVIQKDPGNLDAWLEGGDAARQMGDVDKAVDMHMRARGLAPEDPRVQEALAADFEALGELKRAISHLERRAEMDPGPDAETWAWLRDLYVRQGQWADAETAQEKRFKSIRDASLRADEQAILRGLRLERARSLVQQGDEGPEEAMSILRSLLKADPQFVPAWLVLGEARLAEDDAAGAVEAWQEGIEKTRSLPLLEHLVAFHLRSGEPERAVHAYRTAANELEGDEALAARLGLARLYLRLEMLEDAQAELETLEERSEYSPMLQYHLARLLQRRGEDRRAANLFQEVIDSAGLLQHAYTCQRCGATYESYRVRCTSCDRWGTLRQEASRMLHAAKERGVRAPRF